MSDQKIVAVREPFGLICLDCLREDMDEPEDHEHPVLARDIDLERAYCYMCCGLIADTI